MQQEMRIIAGMDLASWVKVTNAQGTMVGSIQESAALMHCRLRASTQWLAQKSLSW